MNEEPLDVPEFDFRDELVKLYRAAESFDEKHKTLALMEKVGGFVKQVKAQADDRDANAPDRTAARVLREINGASR